LALTAACVIPVGVEVQTVQIPMKFRGMAEAEDVFETQRNMAPKTAQLRQQESSRDRKGLKDLGRFNFAQR
jgi:hypothetical protein